MNIIRRGISLVKQERLKQIRHVLIFVRLEEKKRLKEITTSKLRVKIKAINGMLCFMFCKEEILSERMIK